MAHKTVHKTAHKTAHSTYKMVHLMAHKTVHKTVLVIRWEMVQASAGETVLLMKPLTKLGIRLNPMMPMTSAMWAGHGNAL